MKNIYLWAIGAVVIIVAGIWLVTSNEPAQPEISASPTLSETPVPTPTPSPKATDSTVTPKPTSTRTPNPTPTPTPAPAVINPTITSVTVTAPTTDVASWTAVISGGLPSAPSGQCYKIVPPSFYEEANTYHITLKANLASSTTACMYGFTQTIQLGATSTTPGIHYVYVNNMPGTSYIVPEPTQ